MLTRRHLLAGLAALPLAGTARANMPPNPDTRDWRGDLVAAARAQIGITLLYDPAYVAIDYPMGDVPRDRGVCTDVVVRAYRDALGRDLQQLVHEDMKANFSAYPDNWGLARPDSNIDHRRVPNLRTFLGRMGVTRAPEGDMAGFARGDLVTMILPRNLPHIAMISDRMSADGTRPLIIHNIGRGTREEDRLAEFPLTGRYSWSG